MEHTTPVIRFVRCPKCLKILTEFSDIPVYKCGGCGAILRAKVRSNSGQSLSSVSAIPASQTLPDSDPSSNRSESLRQEISDSDVNRVVEQTEINSLNVSDLISENACKEKSVAHVENKVQDFNVSDLNGEVYEAKREPSALEGTSNRHILEEGNEEPEKSPNVNSDVYDSEKSSDKLEESSEPMEHYATLEEDMMSMELGNYTHFRKTSRNSSEANEGNASHSDKDGKYHDFHLSRRTFRNKNISKSTNITDTVENSLRRFSTDRLYSSATCKLSSNNDVQTTEQDSFLTSQSAGQNWIKSENHGSSSSPTKDAKVKINRRLSGQDNQVKILSRVDDLRNELTGLFNDTSNSKDSSLSGIKASQFQGKVPSKVYRSSLIPFSRQPSSSFFHNYSGDKCCHNEHCRPCPHNVCCHLSEPAILPLHMKARTINQEAQNVQFKISKPQNIIRLCRPVSGGAPFVICYKCFKLLQLPADFLISPKRVNKLRCGACSQVLMYFFRPRSPSIPQTPVEGQHPPSEENEELNVAAADENLSRYENITAWDPNSSSESNSSEVEPAMGISRSFDEIVEEGEDGYLRGSRLHNLMGYSSASELLLYNGYSQDGYQSTEPNTPNFYMPSGRKKDGSGTERN